MMRRGWIASGLVLALSLPGIAAAQQEPPRQVPSACASGALAKLVKWVVSAGQPATLPAYLFKLPTAEDVPVLQIAYRNTTTKIVHDVDVDIKDSRCGVVFVYDDGGSVTTWVTDVTGIVARTYYLSRGEAVRRENQIVPNQQYAGQYDEMKRYFIDKIPEPDISPVARALRRLFGAE
jgi:hypothetical protein